MTKLMREILNDPNAVFELEADLPSGNRMIGTVGPLIDGKLASAITFAHSPASEEDIATALHVVNTAMGHGAAFATVSENLAERKASLEQMRQFMGGGVG